MRIFSVPRPSKDASREIVLKMYRSLGAKLFPGIELPELPDSIVCNLAWRSPRAVQLAIREAFGRAAFEGRRLLDARDFPEVQVRTWKLGFV